MIESKDIDFKVDPIDIFYDYTGPDMGSVKYHKKVKHGKYCCKSCLFMTDSIKLRNQHIQTVHGYQCGLCDYNATSANGLKWHIKSKHDFTRYPCDKCEYAATTANYLKIHKEIKHEGIRYPCSECEFAATTANHLKVHKECKHEGIRYLCEYCEYSATQKGDLNRHKKKKHN